jgi:ligand-binding SRPBCC domain-containing protein
MHIYKLEKKTVLKADMVTVWNYFSTPLNLNELTPDDMSFEILTDLQGLKMYPGMIINYRIRPVLNIPFRWTTEITHCLEGEYFVDEQRFGPYAFWHHQHKFRQVEGGVEMTDIVHYGLPFGFIGRIANAIFVQKKLQGIFDYRDEKVKNIF